MPVEILLWVVLAAIAISIACTYFLKVNLGIPALIFSYIIGCWIQGMKVNDVVALWPTSTAFQLMFMLGGVCTLMGVASKAGVVNYIAGLLSDSVSPVMMGVVLSLLGSFLSLFSGAINAVYPMLGVVAVNYATAGGFNAMPLLIAVTVGASATAISPFSSGGATMIANCPDQSIQESLFMKAIVLAVVGAAISMILSVVGVHSIF